MAASYSFTDRSRNLKTGPCPVMTATRDNCPDTCPLKERGCYANQHYLGKYWRTLSATLPGQWFAQGRYKVRALSWREMLGKVRALAPGIVWRAFQAGDFPHKAGKVRAPAIRQMVKANNGKPAIVYSHHVVAGRSETARHNRALFKFACDNGLTVNASANSLDHADRVAATGLPVVVIVPEGTRDNLQTPQGRKVVICPYPRVQCVDCKLCTRADRPCLIGFPAHGAQRSHVDLVSRG